MYFHGSASSLDHSVNEYVIQGGIEEHEEYEYAPTSMEHVQYKNTFLHFSDSNADGLRRIVTCPTQMAEEARAPLFEPQQLTIRYLPPSRVPIGTLPTKTSSNLHALGSARSSFTNETSHDRAVGSRDFPAYTVPQRRNKLSPTDYIEWAAYSSSNGDESWTHEPERLVTASTIPSYWESSYSSGWKGKGDGKSRSKGARWEAPISLPTRQHAGPSSYQPSYSSRTKWGDSYQSNNNNWYDVSQNWREQDTGYRNQRSAPSYSKDKAGKDKGGKGDKGTKADKGSAKGKRGTLKGPRGIYIDLGNLALK